MPLEILHAPVDLSSAALPSINQLRHQEASRGVLTDELADDLRDRFFGQMGDDVPLLILRGSKMEQRARKQGIDTQELWSELSKEDQTHVAAWRDYLDNLPKEQQRTKSALIRVMGVPDTWNLPASIEDREPTTLGKLRVLMSNIRTEMGDEMGIDCAFLYRMTRVRELHDDVIAKIRTAIDTNVPHRSDDEGYVQWLTEIVGLSDDKELFLRALLMTLRAQPLYQEGHTLDAVSDDDLERWAMQERVLADAAQHHGATELDVEYVYFEAEPSPEDCQARYDANSHDLLDRLGLEGLTALVERFDISA